MRGALQPQQKREPVQKCAIPHPGSPVVAACVAAGTDYVDINGEPAWHASIIDAHDARARAKSVLLVLACGFDSIPSDLGEQRRDAARNCRDRDMRHARH